MFSQDPIIQKTQMETLAADVAAALAATTVTTVIQTTQPDQSHFQVTSTPFAPEKRFIWSDGKYIRGEYGTIRDFLMPFTTSSKTYPGEVDAVSQIFWWDRTRFILNGNFYTTTAGATTTRNNRFWIDGSTSLIAALTAGAYQTLSVNSAFGYAVLWNGAGTLSSINLSTGVIASLTNATVTAVRPVACFDDSGNLYFISAAAPTLVKKKIFPGSVVTTIATVTADVQEMRWDEVSQRLLLFCQTPPAPASYVTKMDSVGGNVATLVASGDYAGGNYLSSYHFVGYSVEAGYLYVPVPGSRYISTTRRKYDITTGAYVDEVFDYGEAKAAFEAASKEAKAIVENAQGKITMQKAAWGAEYLAYVFERLVHAERSPTDDAYLLMYETGPLSPLPGAAAGIAWAVLPDDGVSGKIYPLTEQTDPRGDFFIVKEFVYDVATKEMTLDWSDINLDEFETIAISFDIGLTTATENVRVQLNGDTAANYSMSFWRNVVATITNTSNATTYWELYGVNSTTQLGGKYKLLFVDHRSRDDVGVVVEGVATTAISSGTVNSVLGVGKWDNPVAKSQITSIRIFLSGSTAFFAANAMVQVMAYRTRHTYSNRNAWGHE